MSGALTLIRRGDRELVLTRIFDAPGALVFDAWTRPELLRRWFGPHGHHLVVCEVDLRVGGAWVYVIRDPSGMDMRLTGTYRELVVAQRLVTTHRTECEDHDDEESVLTTTFVEENGRTTVTTVQAFATADVCDAVYRSGMKRGYGEGMDQLARLLASMNHGGVR